MLSCSTLVLLLDTCQTAVTPPSRKLIQSTSLAMSESMCWCVHVLMFACCNALSGLTANPCFNLHVPADGPGLDEWLSAEGGER